LIGADGMSRTKYWKACNDALRQEMARDRSVIVLGEDVAGAPGRAGDGFVDAWGGPFGITRGLIKEFGPERVRDTPISEAGFLGLAAGLAADGYRPWVDIMFTELMPVAWDQLTNRIARGAAADADHGEDVRRVLLRCLSLSWPGMRRAV
jgi:pyruvate dehydrogenase E1 component beta subunit